MTHQELAFEFCSFVYDFMNEIDNIKFINKSDEMFYRVCFQKLYYALYHKILHHDMGLSESDAPGQHETIMKKINRNGDDQLKQIYGKMKALRIWADYKLSNLPPHSPKIPYIQHQVYRILQRSTLDI